VLDDFFPRYLSVLTKKNIITSSGEVKFFKNSISEVRIEGHTNSVWSKSIPEKEAYYLNMALSQGRTRSVLTYIYDLATVEKDRPWIKEHIAAVGFSSSRPIYIEADCNHRLTHRENTCTEDMAKSRRVSFRIITNADTEIQKILATLQ
jgi:outer membrane protein OmpA-like peptidoglycan-associated protein